MRGQTLRNLRGQTGLSQAELAELAATTPGTIYRLEADKRDCTSTLLRSIANVISEVTERPVGDILAELTEENAAEREPVA